MPAILWRYAIPMEFEKVRRQGREAVFQVSRVDLVRQIADLVPLTAGCFAEQDVPFRVLAPAVEYQPEQERLSTRGLGGDSMIHGGIHAPNAPVSLAFETASAGAQVKGFSSVVCCLPDRMASVEPGRGVSDPRGRNMAVAIGKSQSLTHEGKDVFWMYRLWKQHEREAGFRASAYQLGGGIVT